MPKVAGKGPTTIETQEGEQEARPRAPYIGCDAHHSGGHIQGQWELSSQSLTTKYDRKLWLISRLAKPCPGGRRIPLSVIVTGNEKQTFVRPLVEACHQYPCEE